MFAFTVASVGSLVVKMLLLVLCGIVLIALFGLAVILVIVITELLRFLFW